VVTTVAPELREVSPLALHTVHTVQYLQLRKLDSNTSSCRASAINKDRAVRRHSTGPRQTQRLVETQSHRSKCETDCRSLFVLDVLRDLEQAAFLDDGVLCKCSFFEIEGVAALCYASNSIAFLEVAADIWADFFDSTH